MKVIYRAVKANGEFGTPVVMDPIPDHVAYERAHKAYPNDPDYVERKLDGDGYIHILSGNSRITYAQE